MTLVLGFDETTKEGLPELVEKAQRLLLQARRYWDIRFAHVKGHADIEGNVNADKNAEKGKTKGDFAAFSLVHRLWSTFACWDAAEVNLLKQRIGSCFPRSTMNSISPEIDEPHSDAASVDAS